MNYKSLAHANQRETYMYCGLQSTESRPCFIQPLGGHKCGHRSSMLGVAKLSQSET